MIGLLLGQFPRRWPNIDSTSNQHIVLVRILAIYFPDKQCRFQPQIYRVQNRGTFLWTVGKYRGVIRSKIVFLESVTFQFHARMLSSEVAQLLKSSDLGDGIALSHRHVGIFRVKQIHPSTASERTTRQGPTVSSCNLL